jgi:hypothetical protein
MSATVPFIIDDVYNGFAETEGILSVDGDDLKFEFQTADKLVGLLKSGVREVRLPLEKIEEITFRKRWYGNKLVIRVSEMGRASELPNFKQGEVELKVAKKHREAASELLAFIQTAQGAQTGK